MNNKIWMMESSSWTHANDVGRFDVETPFVSSKNLNVFLNMILLAVVMVVVVMVQQHVIGVK